MYEYLKTLGALSFHAWDYDGDLLAGILFDDGLLLPVIVIHYVED